MGLPWLSQPVMLHGGRDPGECTMTPEQCAYKYRYWVFWYEADHRYALPTVAFFLVAIVLFTIFHLLSVFAPRSWRRSGPWERVVSFSRLLSYTSWRFGNWNTHSLGTYILGGIGAVFFLAMMLGPQPYYWPNTKEISYGDSPPIATRSGWMALGCLPIILILAVKANPIATLIGSSHEKLIVWHNWIAWAMLVLALVHTFPFIVYHIWAGDIVMNWNMEGLWLTGVIALLAQTWMTVMSIRSIRERYYEFFKATHFFVALVFVIFLFLHCDFILTSWDYFIAAGVLYTLSWLYSQCRVWMEHGLKHRARLTLVTNNMVKISIRTSPHASWAPGQHIYLRFLTLGLHSLTAHPFTICSAPAAGKDNEMVFYVKPRGGFTGRLAKLAQKPDVAIPVLLDGPYGGVTNRWFQGFDKTLVVGGGSGSGFTLSLVEDFMSRKSLDRETQMTVIVATRDLGMRNWYLAGLGEIAARRGQDNGYEDEKTRRVTVQIYETGTSGESMRPSTDIESRSSEDGDAKATKESSDVQATVINFFEVRFFKGRPDLKAAAQRLAATEDANVGIVVCGPSSMIHDVSQAAATAQKSIMRYSNGAREVWLHKESFSS